MTDIQTGEQRHLGASDVQVSSLGIGAWSWGDRGIWGYGKEYNQADVEAAFRAALDAGIDFFDTAEIYGGGESERIVGACLRQTDRHVVVASKFAPLPYRLSASALIPALDASLKRLGMETLDLYQIHWPYTLIDTDSLMDALALAAKAGKVRAVGVSNFSAKEMYAAHARLAHYGVPLASNQVHYNLLKRSPEANGVLDACRDLNVALIAYSPLAQGLLTGRYSGPDAATPTGPRRFYPGFRNNGARVEPVVQVLREVAQAHDKTPAQVALNWLLRRDTCIIAIPGAKTAKQAQQNAGALGWQITDAEFARIDQASLPWKK